MEWEHLKIEIETRSLAGGQEVWTVWRGPAMCKFRKQKLRGQLLFLISEEDWNVEEDEEFLKRINVIRVRPS